MVQNRIMNLAPPQGFDSKLIVFLNYQELFLVFSKTSIDIYDRHLARKARTAMDRVIPRLEKSYPYADNTYENIAFISETQDILVCYYNDRLRTGKIDMFDLLTGEHLFFRDSRSTNPSDNYGLEDVSGLFFDFERDKLYTGQSRHNHSQIGTRAGLVHVWSA